jgi:hypothetical protein
MEIEGILFIDEGGDLLSIAANKGGLQHFKKEFRFEDFGMDLHPGPAFLALGQILTGVGNSG